MKDKSNVLDTTAATAACLEETDRIVGTHGPRLAGTRSCLAASEEIAGKLRGFADSVGLEPFGIHPGSFYSYMKILPPSYLAGMAALLASGVLRPAAALGLEALAIAGLAAGIVLMVCQFAFYWKVGDVLFRRRTGMNVEAVIEPTGEPQREFVLSGHHDSAPVARIFSGPFDRLLAVALLAPYLFFIVELALLLAGLCGRPAPRLRGWELPFLLAGLPFVAGYFFLVALRRGSPGAGDNLVSSLMLVGLGREVAARRESLLRATRLRIVSFDAEEAGLRDLQVFTSDVNGTVRLSRSLADRLIECARECGFEMRTFGMIFGGGGTDAAESARAGIPSTSVVALPTAIVRTGLVYHTPRDTVEHVEPAAVEACLRIALRLLERLELDGAIARPGDGAVARPGDGAAAYHTNGTRIRRSPG